MKAIGERGSDMSVTEWVPLREAKAARVGGKARGLARLMATGLSVPDGLVLLSAGGDSIPEPFVAATLALGGAVAVRSSAADEDGTDFSFAGQFESVLDVAGERSLREAIARCVASGGSDRVRAYRDAHAQSSGAAVAVIVQRMVQPRFAGALFTIDPVSGKRDRIVIDAVEGLGEALMSGHRSPSRYVLSREGEVIERDEPTRGAHLDAELLARLVRESRIAEEAFGHALDMEWALDADGAIQWLQARPITTVDLPTIDEFDTPLRGSACTLTRHNVGEVLPGASTPLTWDCMGSRLLDGMREIYAACGVPVETLDAQPLVVIASGHLFLNLTSLYSIGDYVLGTSKENLDYSVAGQLLAYPKETVPAPMPIRAINAARYFRHLFKASDRVDDFERRARAFRLGSPRDARGWHDAIGRAIELQCEAYRVHVHTSSLSGTLHGVLTGIWSDGGRATAEHHADIAELLRGAEHETRGSDSSLGLAPAIAAVERAIRADAAGAARFAAMSPDDGLLWLRENGPADVRRAFATLLRDHGHRGIRECELRSRDWSEDPLPVVKTLQASVATERRVTGASRVSHEGLLRALPGAKRRIVRWILPRARAAVALRERTKSLAVRITREIRHGYLALAESLRTSGRLRDTDLVFFLTHDELGRLVNGADASLERRAVHRRRLYATQELLEFPFVVHGKPTPVEPDTSASPSDAVLSGTPVSRGVVIGRVRVARTADEAADLQNGEVLVAPHTDVGWAPHFARAAGLATEVGGTLSHGAVVAREYGLPALVNVQNATRVFRTGDTVRLDAEKGELRKL